MSAEPCTIEQAEAALGYLTRCFGGYKIPDDESRAFVRLFRNYTPAEVARAVDELVLKADRRPSPWEVATQLRGRRPAVPDTRNAEPWPASTPEAVSQHVAELREIAAGRKEVTA